MTGADQLMFLSTARPSRTERGLALGVILVSVAVFIACVPFAKMPLAILAGLRSSSSTTLR